MSAVSGTPLKSAKFYKVKNPRKHFLCALCRAPRQLKYTKNLSLKNYFQLTVLASFLVWASFPLMAFKSLFWVWIIWPAAELVNKLLYRREIPCPYCGFDATWYKRDIRVAKRKVEDFWKTNHPELVGRGKEMADAVAEGSPSHNPEARPITDSEENAGEDENFA